MYISAQHKITTLIKLRTSEKDEIITTMQNFVSVLCSILISIRLLKH